MCSLNAGLKDLHLGMSHWDNRLNISSIGKALPKPLYEPRYVVCCTLHMGLSALLSWAAVYSFFFIVKSRTLLPFWSQSNKSEKGTRKPTMLIWLILHPYWENLIWPSASTSRESKVRLSLKSVDEIFVGGEGTRETMLWSKLLLKKKKLSNLWKNERDFK